MSKHKDTIKAILKTRHTCRNITFNCDGHIFMLLADIDKTKCIECKLQEKEKNAKIEATHQNKKS